MLFFVFLLLTNMNFKRNVLGLSRCHYIFLVGLVCIVWSFVSVIVSFVKTSPANYLTTAQIIENFDLKNCQLPRFFGCFFFCFIFYNPCCQRKRKSNFQAQKYVHFLYKDKMSIGPNFWQWRQKESKVKNRKIEFDAINEKLVLKTGKWPLSGQ